MASRTGIVQKIIIGQNPRTACVYVGSSPENAELFTVDIQDSDASLKLDGLGAAMMGRRQVTVTHNDDDSKILTLMMD